MLLFHDSMSKHGNLYITLQAYHQMSCVQTHFSQHTQKQIQSVGSVLYRETDQSFSPINAVQGGTITCDYYPSPNEIIKDLWVECDVVNASLTDTAHFKSWLHFLSSVEVSH